MTLFGAAFQNKRVLVTGHTGFKGAWLSQWLLELGAEVTGLSLPPNTDPSLFNQLGLASRVHHVIGDIQDPVVLRKVVAEAQPDFVFHLAAQALVRESYVRAQETFNVNVMGTLHVLEALKELQHPCAAVFITTDKCYENREWLHGYREEDPLGGRDPYSASKAAAELVIGAYRSSFFQKNPVRVASCRAGNVIGGGDWAKDRIVPDCIRALNTGNPIAVRNRFATRPWQHVLEPLSGYLWLAALMAQPELRNIDPVRLASAFNFGPDRESNRTVEELVCEVLRHWPGRWEDKSIANAPHEASLLHLSTDKAHALLGWTPVWNFPESIQNTVLWYSRAMQNPENVRDITSQQIREYTDQARRFGLPWVCPPAQKGQKAL